MSGVVPAGLPTSAPAPEPRATRPADRSSFEHALDAAGREPKGEEPVDVRNEGDENEPRPAEPPPEALLAALVAFAPPPPPAAASTAAQGAPAAAPAATLGGSRGALAGAGGFGTELRVDFANPSASAPAPFGRAGADALATAALASTNPAQAASGGGAGVHGVDSAAGQPSGLAAASVASRAPGAAAAALASASLINASAPAGAALVNTPTDVAAVAVAPVALAPAAAGESGVVSNVAAKAGGRGQTALAGRSQALPVVRARQGRGTIAEAALPEGVVGARGGADAALPRFSFDRVSLSAESAQGGVAEAAGPETGALAGAAGRSAKPNVAAGAAPGAEGREGAESASPDLAGADAGQLPATGAERATSEASGLGAAPGEAAPAPGVAAHGVATPAPAQMAARAAVEPRAPAGADAANGDDERQRLVAAGVNRLTLRREGLRAEAEVPELGRVSVEARTAADGAIDVRVAAADPAAAMALGRHQGEIVQALEAASVPVGRVSVEAQGQGAQHAFRDGGGAARDGARGGRERDSGDEQPSPRPGGRRRVRIVL